MSNLGRVEELARVLNLIPYFEAHPGRSVFEAARDLGRTPPEIMADLNRLFCCGLPGLMPDNLVDMVHSYTSVRITNNQGLDRALRLSAAEASVLLMMLESLENQPGLVDAASVRSAATKLRAITGASAIFDSTPQQEDSQVGEAIRRAIEDNKQLRFMYASASSDTERLREVTPLRVVMDSGHQYLSAWEEGHRTFRLDRMSGPEVVDKPGAAPADVGFSFDLDRQARLEVHRDAAWLAEYYPISLEGNPQGEWIAATMPYGSTEWLVRFALSNADRLRIISPSQVSSQVSLRAARAIAAYDGSQTTTFD
ncbi:MULTISPECIES: WYL domain-containing protein [unclassified Corynebacterium]|uniref:WYL domain-containing protein n=1 Tax=unclassified Corynebacterium TaxID=2624378 RepID=UPI0029CA0941|nr:MULTISPECIES: WYL domain-containing protein [unclassified Corynebacterium]WPF67186.1 WYL domain-containing protein [Corynebacterium sp. 22KM0430]WPF69675.1 WYL domain-containing protein [Corynebacterium sp. 21KM1197]